MVSSRIMDLASNIVASTAGFDVFLESLNLHSPLFDVSAIAHLPSSKELQGARIAIIEATSELQALVLGPVGMSRNNALKATEIGQVPRK